MSHSIYHNLLIKTSPEVVFDAVSQPRHLDNWWTLKSSGTPQVDETYNLNFTDEYDWYCKVSQLELNTSIHFKMTQSDSDWNPTTFGFDLEEREEGTYLRFSHINWEDTNEHFKVASFCWAMLLNGLKNYLEKDLVVPFEERS
ncbi:SRPBCC family protein [Aestuariivivens sediminis]|uniref:SRPBCC family protein n=1 Tax=Aestuariivivens sediminis TaxID=2913557 RepID=UPI001F58F5EA|nr:SRPBCC domain-containing protein [Aestuariivivens sediminis]